MKIVIDIPEEVYKRVVVSPRCTPVLDAFEDRDLFVKALQSGTPLPKGHGRLGDLDTLYREIETKGWFDSDDAYYGGGLEDILLSAPTLIEADKEVGE